MRKLLLAAALVGLVGVVGLSRWCTSQESLAAIKKAAENRPPPALSAEPESVWEPAPADWPSLTVSIEARPTRTQTLAPIPRPNPYRRFRYPKSRYRYGILVREPAQDPTYSAVIKHVAHRYRVPAGILYGIWKKESSWLKGGWANGGSWHYAPTLLRANGPCVRRYGYAKCKYHFDALRAICSQRRNGLPICDPNRVRVSYAGAMGPMQHMPGVLLWCRNGPCRWSRHAVDYDGDGTIDPHYLPEAMAMTALYLVNRFNGKTCGRFGRNIPRRWKCATDLYFGIGTAGYFSGGNGKSGVVRWWRRWCQFGHCGQ